MKANIINFRLGQQITKKSDRLIVWNTKFYPDYRLIENRFHQCDFYQFEEEEYDPETKRLWIYVNSPENKLMYICEVIPVEGKLSANPNCDFCYTSIMEYNEGKTSSYTSNKICKFAYKLNLIHKFCKGNGLEELKTYQHEETGINWKPPQKFVYVGSYPGLIKNVIAEKIW